VRPNADLERIRALVRELARSATEDTTIYLTGGATAVLHGWRDSTVDIDLRLEPDSDDLLRRIATVKDDLHVNVELASPPDFIPELPGWRERDVRAMIDHALVDPERLGELFEAIEPKLFRYPSIDARDFRSKLARTLGR
jgi:hypothetical protein